MNEPENLICEISQKKKKNIVWFPLDEDTEALKFIETKDDILVTRVCEEGFREL